MTKLYANKEWLIDVIRKYKNITDISLNTSIPKTTLKRNIDKMGLADLLEKKEKKIKVNLDKYPYKSKEWLLEKLQQYGTPNEIVRNEGWPETSIRRYIEKYDLKNLIDKSCHKKVDEKKDIYLYKDDEWLLNAILKYKSVSAICQETGFAQTSIRRYIKRYKLEEYLEPCESKRNLSLNESYFEKIDSEKKAYWLGLLMADGNVMNDNSRYCIRLSLKAEDAYIVKQLKKDLESDANIYYDKYGRATLRVWSKKMFNDLRQHGIVPNKTGKEIIPCTIPETLMNHFVRGFFDGDGTIYKRANRERHKGTVGFCCQNRFFLVQLTELFKKKYNFSLTIHPHKNNVYECKTESYSKCRDIIKYMYNNATITMLRKYYRAVSYYNLSCPSLKQFEDEFR